MSVLTESHQKPTALRFADFNVYVKQSGKFIGRKCLDLSKFRKDKLNIVRLDNPAVRDKLDFHDVVANPTDELCLAKICKLCQNHFPIDYTGAMLRRPKPAKEIAFERKQNPDGPIMMADLSEKGHFGKNYPSVVCAKVAKMIGLKDSRGKLNLVDC